jgi:hypothetical protein
MSVGCNAEGLDCAIEKQIIGEDCKSQSEWNFDFIIRAMM